MALPERPAPMNAITNHSKVKLSITVPDPTFVGGRYVSGKMEMECRADKGLGIGVIMIELFGIQELSSRDHSATSTFLHAQRLFQGPGLPPSNAVQAHAEPGDPPLPAHHYHARRGISTFLFKIPLPPTCPSSVSFGGGLATVKYELRASVSVSWRGDKQVVTEHKLVDVVDTLDDQGLTEYANGNNDATSITVGENGKLWMQGRIVGGGIITAGESACVELQVKNHSAKKNAGLCLSLTRQLVLPNIPSTEKQPVQVTDTLTNVAFRGPEYIIQPGVEGIANLVFDIPKDARGVKAGPYQDEEGDSSSSASRPRLTPSIFEVQCVVTVKMTMGIGNKDLVLNIPVTVVNPLALPEDLVFLPQERLPYMAPLEAIPGPYSIPATFPDTYAYTPYPLSPPPPAVSPQPPVFSPYADTDRVWLPPPSQSPFPYQYIPPINPLYPPPVLTSPEQFLQNIPPRPASALASSYTAEPTISGLPHAAAAQHPLLPLNLAAHYESVLQQQQQSSREEGKGDRASRVTHHLHMSSRNRSVSPPSHRYPLPHSSPGRPTWATAEIDVPVHARTLPHPPPRAGPTSEELTIPPPALHAPRPLLSPKLSQASLRSERVEELERLAAAAAAEEEEDVRAQRPSSNRKKKKRSRKGKEKEVADINKTLPPPPVPTRSKGFLLDAVSSAYDPAATPLEKAPPTPTITAVTPVRHARSNLTEKLAAAKMESGLDALERRLLAEVGTQKVERLFSAPTAQAIFGRGGLPPSNVAMNNVASTSGGGGEPAKGRLSPIKIPAPRDVGDDSLNIDSAISSLTLADGGWAMGLDRKPREERAEVEPRRRSLIEEGQDHEIDGDSDERTHRAGTIGGKSKSKSSLSGDDGLEEQHTQGRRHRRHAADGLSEPEGRSRDLAKEKKSGKKKDGHKQRKSAKGRVAAWLGTIEPIAFLPEDNPLLDSVTAPQPSSEPLHDSNAMTQIHDPTDQKRQDVPIPQLSGDVPTAAPNPRSSGFIPIGTQKKREMHVNANINPPVASVTHQSTVNQTFKNLPVAPSAIKPIKREPVSRPTKEDTPPLLRQQKTSDGIQSKQGRVVRATADDPSKAKAPPSSRDTRPNLRLPQSSPPGLRAQGLEPKYDAKSARGGRGGKVTAIAAFWASAAGSEVPKGLSKSPPPASATSRKQTMSTASTPVNIQRVSKPARPQIALSTKRSAPDISKGSPSIASSEASPKLLGLAGKSNPVTKSPSVPAIVSSSLATPMLSSTASLARSPFQQTKRPKITAISNNVPPQTEPSDKPLGPSKAKSTPDLAFGKARLRDLIKKYQEQAS